MIYERMINSEQETEQLAGKLAALLAPADVLTLEGDLGKYTLINAENLKACRV